MSQAVLSHRDSRVSEHVLATAAYGGITTGIAAVSSIVNPVTGLVFGLTSAVTQQASDALCAHMGCAANSTLAKVARCGLSLIVGTAIAWAVCNAIAMPITLTAAAVLTAATTAVALGVSLVFDVAAMWIAQCNDSGI
jgi:hypothetical protein